MENNAERSEAHLTLMYWITSGIVLNKEVTREADKLLTIYTYKFGKLKAIAPGACKISARLLQATEPITESEFMLYINPKSLMRVKIVGAELKNMFTGLRDNIERFTFASRIAKVVNMLTGEYDKSIEIYQLLKRGLELAISSSTETFNKIYLAFVLRFLKLSGYGIDYFSVELNIEELDALNKLSRLSGEDVIRLNLSITTENSLMKFLDRYLTTKLSS